MVGGSSSIRSLRNLITLALAVYAIVAVAGSQLSRSGEWFPVFSWSLFSKVGALGYATRLEIVSIDGEPLDPPQFYRNLRDTFAKASDPSISLNKLLDRIAYDHHIGAPNTGRLRELKNRYLAEADRIEWRIVRLITDPIEYYQTGAVAKRYVWLEGAFPAPTAK